MKFLLFLLVVAGIVALVHFRATARERNWEAEFPPLGQFVEVDSHRVHAVVQGDGPDLVLIHGSSGNLRDFTFQMVEALAPNYRVIAFDRPGLGYTDRLPEGSETIHDQAALLQQAAAQLGAEQPIVLGQSYGGAVALSWALNHPENTAALVLVASPTQPWDTPLPGLYRLNSTTLGAALAVPLITALVPRGYIHRQIEAVFEPDPMPKGYDEYVGAELAARRTSLRANATQRSTLLAEITEMQPSYPALTLPIELIHGTTDTTVGFGIHAEPFVDQVPSANLTPLPDTGHLPHQTEMPATIAAIDRAASRAGLR